MSKISNIGKSVRKIVPLVALVAVAGCSGIPVKILANNDASAATSAASEPALQCPTQEPTPEPTAVPACQADELMAIGQQYGDNVYSRMIINGEYAVNEVYIDIAACRAPLKPNISIPKLGLDSIVANSEGTPQDFVILQPNYYSISGRHHDFEDIKFSSTKLVGAKESDFLKDGVFDRQLAEASLAKQGNTLLLVYNDHGKLTKVIERQSGQADYSYLDRATNLYAAFCGDWK